MQSPRTGETRRRFILSGLQWLAAGTVSLLLVPVARFARYRVKPKPRFVRVAAPLPLAGFHAEREFILFARDSGGVVAVSRKCTHLGCRVSYLEDKKIIECPCHQSRFTPTGKRLAGPARRNLPTFAVATEKDAQGNPAAYVVRLT